MLKNIQTRKHANQELWGNTSEFQTTYPSSGCADHLGHRSSHISDYPSPYVLVVPMPLPNALIDHSYCSAVKLFLFQAMKHIRALYFMLYLHFASLAIVIACTVVDQNQSLWQIAPQSGIVLTTCWLWFASRFKDTSDCTVVYSYPMVGVPPHLYQC